MNTFNKRQHQLMVKALKEFRAKKISLDDLINKLELFYLIEDVNKEIQDKFFEEWITLEEVYAFSLENQQSLEKLSEEDNKLINRAVKNLEILLEEINNQVILFNTSIDELFQLYDEVRFKQTELNGEEERDFITEFLDRENCIVEVYRGEVCIGKRCVSKYDIEKVL